MKLTPFRLDRLADITGAELHGEDREITGAADPNSAGPGDITFIRTAGAAAHIQASRAGAACVPTDTPALSIPTLRHPNPRWVFAHALSLLAPARRPTLGIHPLADVHPEATLDDTCSIAAHAVIDAGAVLDAGVVVGPGAVVGRDCRIGRESRIDAAAVLHESVIVGRRVRIFANAVIGADGFGFEVHEGCIKRMPHIGDVVIEDDVEIGAATCIDRATTGTTRIGAATKIDNLVMIGHNCDIGRGCMIAGCTGIAGSVRVEDGCIIGGAVRIRDHVTIGAGARIAGGSGVWSDVPAGASYSGYPARDHRREMRELLAIARLPEALRRLSRDIGDDPS